jgi:hypothetical protein
LESIELDINDGPIGTVFVMVMVGRIGVSGKLSYRMSVSPAAFPYCMESLSPSG